MKKQTDQQRKTHGKTTKDNHNKEQIQTQDKELLTLKAGYNQHASLFSEPTYSKRTINKLYVVLKEKRI